jgi:hypothetical protein
MINGWVGVDLDGTLAEYHGYDPRDPLMIGRPIPRMVKLVKRLLKKGVTVKIFTARVDGGVYASDFGPEAKKQYRNVRLVRMSIQDWCHIHIGERLEVTNVKDARMIKLYDDRAVQVEMNTGRLITKQVVKRAVKAAVVGRL